MRELMYASLLRLAQLQAQPLDRVALHSCVMGLDESHLKDHHALINDLITNLHLPKQKWISGENSLRVNAPCLAFGPELGCAVFRGPNSRGQWLFEIFDLDTHQWIEKTFDSIDDLSFVKLRLSSPYQALNSPVLKLIKDRVLHERRGLIEVVLAGMMINLLALGASLYSMQVYDRVVPTGAIPTLLALTIGVLLAFAFELILKSVKLAITEKIVDAIDAELARVVYTRFMSIRLDQMPNSVGGMAGQLKGYEIVRNFLVAAPAQLLIDMPFALIYIFIVISIGGLISLIPVVFLVITLAIGLAYRKKYEQLTSQSNAASNLKTGLLVETIEGAETIKSGQGGWRMLMRWLHTTDQAREIELQMRGVSDHSQHWIAAFHQISYALMVAYGAIEISKGNMSMGGLIACTILSGRILGPIVAIPPILLQWGQTKAALSGLDQIWRLQIDQHDVEHPVVPSTLRGAYEFNQVEASYGQHKAISIPKLIINPGEKIAILGAIGSGKTTLLRLLTGMYKPQSGHIHLDGTEISTISKPVLAESLGYLQQEGRLFSGTLRENLILGMIDPGDAELMKVSQLTGLHQLVTSKNPLGLQLNISEGGQGLSIGQKQLVNLTRVFLRRPKIWLLDEPTDSLDRALEMNVIQALSSQVKPSDTLVLVTHKLELLSLVDRIIVVANHKIVMDGSKSSVLEQLQKPIIAQQANALKEVKA